MGAKKLCLSCMRKIPLFAGRCPYCIDDNQGVHGRFFLVLLLLIGLILFANWYVDSKDEQRFQAQEKQQFIQELKGSGISK